MTSLPQWVAALLLVLLSLVVLLTVFAWRWAVRGPRSATGRNMPEETERPLVYVAIGASDVVGQGAVDPERDNWASVLHSFMPLGTRIVRLARSGITLREANAREVFLAVEAQPDIVTLWNCVNDLGSRVPLPEYARELEIALGRLTRETRARIAVLNVPDLSRLLVHGVSGPQRALIRGGIQQWNRTIGELASRYAPHVTLIDLFAVSEDMMAQGDYVAADGFHLSSAGHRALAEMVWEVIKDWLVSDEPQPRS